MIAVTKPYIDAKIIKGVVDVLKSGFLVQGEYVSLLEKDIAGLNKCLFGLVVNSGTAALHAALVSIGIDKGDEVITSAFSFVATANAILMCGAKPVFVDIDEKTFTIDPSKIENKITSRTKAILTVDLYGQPCSYKEIKKIAKKHNLLIIDDACQAIGAEYKGKPIGSISDITCFSLYATKNIMMGEGGAIVTNKKIIYNFAKRFRQHGQDMEKPYLYYHIGYNYRSTDMSAVIGIMQLKHLKEWTVKRQTNALMLTDGLQGILGIETPFIKDDRTHVFHQYTIRVKQDFPLPREKLQQYLLKNGVKTSIYYPSILPSHTHLSESYKYGMFPVAEKAAREVLSLPVHPGLSKSELKKIIRLIKLAI